MGAAGIMSGAILILAEITPVAERAAYMGLVGGMWGIARSVLPYEVAFWSSNCEYNANVVPTVLQDHSSVESSQTTLPGVSASTSIFLLVSYLNPTISQFRYQ